MTPLIPTRISSANPIASKELALLVFTELVGAPFWKQTEDVEWERNGNDVEDV